MKELLSIKCKYLGEFCVLTQAAQLFDDGRQCAVGDALQFTGHPIWQGPTAQVPRFDVSLHQRHSALRL